MAFANSRDFPVETAPEAARAVLGRWKRVKRTIELALLCSLALTALVAWLSGVDVVGFVRQLAVSAGQAILAGLRFPVQLPLWAGVSPLGLGSYSGDAERISRQSASEFLRLRRHYLLQAKPV